MAALREDTRDVIVALQGWGGRQAGIDVDHHLKEIATVSSDVDRHGMGSMRRLLLSNLQ
jgi:hypothetical protein